MPGEKNLAALLSSMEPVLHADEFVYCSVPDATGIETLCCFRETEGVTVICRREEAERRNLPFVFPCRMITLNVHSSLEAIGFLAAIAAPLAAEGIGVNVISGYYHDHLFVQPKDSERTIAVLRQLQRAAQL
jgi:hypothetical protein